MMLYNDDCLEVLKNIEDETIDLVVTDCPYHIIGAGKCELEELSYATNKKTGEKYKKTCGILNTRLETEIKVVNGRRKKFIKGTNHFDLCGIFSDADSSTYARQGKLFKYNDIKFSDWLPDVYRVLKKGTHCYIMINARNLKELQTGAEKVGFEFQQLLVWNKTNMNGTPNRYYMNKLEFILMLSKRPERRINNMGQCNLLNIPNILGNKAHPTEKPYLLMKVFIENSSNEGQIVLDPFMGAGSTGVACRELKRDFIGIEIDERYFNVAKQRIEERSKKYLL